MRPFGPPIGPGRRAELVAVTQAVYAAANRRKSLLAGQFAMEGDPQRIVAIEAEIICPEGRLRVAHSKPEERPPFEWVYEVTSDVGQVDYFKHYLIRNDDIVLAQRKVLTPIDETEAAIMLSDLAAAQAAMAAA